jgi:hypothetical protein
VRLRRFALVTFFSQSPILSASSRFEDVDITLQKGESEKPNDQTFLATATLTLPEWPEKDSENRLVIPPTARERCEYFIEALTDLVAVFQGCGRSILSPAPSVALESTTLAEKSYLDESRGIFSIHRGESGVRPTIPLETELLSAVTDRLSGVTLLAEACAS